MGFVRSLHAQFLSKIINEAKNVVISINKDNENPFRQFYFHSDIVVSRNVVAFISLIIGLFTISDFLFFDFSLAFFILLVIRIGLIFFSLFIVKYIVGLSDFRLYDKACLFWMIIVSLGILAIDASRPQNFLTQVVIVDIGILVAYLIIPTRFIYQAIPALILSLGEVSLLVIVFEQQILTTIVTSIFSILFSNIIGAVTSWQIRSYRWEIYQDNAKYKESEKLIAIGQTAGMVGHDIRNPLQAITGDIYLLKDDVQKISQNEIRQSANESIDAINENIFYINKIITDLADFSKTTQPQTENVDLASIIEKIAAELKVPSNVKINLTLQPDVKLKTDSSYIKRITANLGNNAIQAMPNGGILVITMNCSGNSVRIIFSDSGEGIPDEIKDKVFRPLFTTKAKGQGFGLAVVKKLVEELNGSITFESRLGEGTTFTIELPIIE